MKYLLLSPLLVLLLGPPARASERCRVEILLGGVIYVDGATEFENPRVDPLVELTAWNRALRTRFGAVLSPVPDWLPEVLAIGESIQASQETRRWRMARLKWQTGNSHPPGLVEEEALLREAVYGARAVLKLHLRRENGDFVGALVAEFELTHARLLAERRQSFLRALRGSHVETAMRELSRGLGGPLADLSADGQTLDEMRLDPAARRLLKLFREKE